MNIDQFIQDSVNVQEYVAGYYNSIRLQDARSYTMLPDNEKTLNRVIGISCSLLRRRGYDVCGR